MKCSVNRSRDLARRASAGLAAAWRGSVDLWQYSEHHGAEQEPETFWLNYQGDMQEALAIQVNYVSTINTHRRFAKDDLRRHGFQMDQLLPVLNLISSVLCRSQETPLRRIGPQRWSTSTPTSPSMRNRTSGSELFHPFSVCWIPDVFLNAAFTTSHLRRPSGASSTSCVLSSTLSRMEPNCRLSTGNIPFRRTTSNT